MKKQKFPSDAELAEIRTLLNGGSASRLLPKNASGVDRMKYALCEQFVIYKLSQKLTQRELAKQVGVDEAVMSKILHYNFEECTLDILIRYLEAVHKDVEVTSDPKNGVKIRVA